CGSHSREPATPAASSRPRGGEGGQSTEPSVDNAPSPVTPASTPAAAVHLRKVRREIVRVSGLSSSIWDSSSGRSFIPCTRARTRQGGKRDMLFGFGMPVALERRESHSAISKSATNRLGHRSDVFIYSTFLIPLAWVSSREGG